MTTTLPATPLHEWQFERWTHLPADYRHITADGRRTVMVGLDHGTSLVPWYGPQRSHTTGIRARHTGATEYRAICTCGWLTDNTTETAARSDADRHAGQRTR